MTELMRAVGFNRYGAADVLENFEIPKPVPRADEVLIQVAAVGVNPADWLFRSGQFRFFMKAKFPFIPGSEIAGKIVQIGANVQQFEVSDYVYTMLPTLKPGGYAEYVVAKATDIAHAPKNLSLGEAAVVPLTALTALQALRDKGQLKAGMRVLINGASGGVGSFAVQIAKVLGASHVMAVTSGRNLDFVTALGADEVMDYSKSDVTRSGKQYDLIFDCIWNRSYWEWRRLLSPNGKIISVNPIAENPLTNLLIKLRGSQPLKSIIVEPSGNNLAVLREWIEAKRVKPMIDRSYPLAEAADAQNYSESKRVRGKLVLLVDEVLAAQRPTTETVLSYA